MSKYKTILDVKQVNDLISILNQNQSPMVNELLGAVRQISSLELQLKATTDELAELKKAIESTRNQPVPVKRAMEKTYMIMQNNALHLRDLITNLKEKIINGCRNTLDAFREKGVSALNGVVKFLHIRPALKIIQDSLNNSIINQEKAINSIIRISEEYHLAGLHLKNIGKTIVGKDTVSDIKPMGSLGKTIKAPFKVAHSCFTNMKKSVDTALLNIEKLEQKAVKHPSSIVNGLKNQQKQPQKNNMNPAVKRVNER